MNSIFITGGAGFIGSCFTLQWLEQKDVSAAVLDKLTYAGTLDSLSPVSGDTRFMFHHGDICDFKLVEAILSQYRPMAVANFAAESHVDRSIDGPGNFIQTNVIGTCRLLDATLQYWNGLSESKRSRFRFLHVSTDEVYGSLGKTGRFTEETPYAPNSPYSASKAASDHFVRAYNKTYGLPTCIINCSNNYGPRQFPEKLIPLMILNAIAGDPLPVYGNGRNIRDWLYVEDHCKALRLVLEKGVPGSVYNIGGNCELSNMQVVQLICELVDRLQPGLPHAPCSSLIQLVKDRPGHDFRYAIDASKIQTELGWRPQHDFASGLNRTVQWYLNNSKWLSRVMSDDFQRERLGLGGAQCLNR